MNLFKHSIDVLTISSYLINANEINNLKKYYAKYPWNYLYVRRRKTGHDCEWAELEPGYATTIQPTRIATYVPLSLSPESQIKTGGLSNLIGQAFRKRK